MFLSAKKQQAENLYHFILLLFTIEVTVSIKVRKIVIPWVIRC